MKKLLIIAVLVTAVCALVLTACGSTSTAVASQVADPSITFVVLDSNPTTGYTWSCSIKDSAVLSLVSDNYTQDEAPAGMTGVGGKHKFVFQGKKAGSTEATLSYGRANQKAQQKRVYKFTVGQELSTSLELISAE
ncbi:MAG: protease inhibitor I42 family protein [Treponema sp.]|nr:protease inhibitor I42 family protein [Treponema sp.]